MQKQELIDLGLDQIGVSSITSDLGTSDQARMLIILEQMMREYMDGWGINLSYMFEDMPVATTESMIPDYANMPIALMFSQRAANYLKIPLDDDMKMRIKASANVILAKSVSQSAQTASQNEPRYPARMPRGSGSRFTNYASFYNFFG